MLAISKTQTSHAECQKSDTSNVSTHKMSIAMCCAIELFYLFLDERKKVFFRVRLFEILKTSRVYDKHYLCLKNHLLMDGRSQATIFIK